MTFGIRNELPIFSHNSTANTNTNTYLEKVLQYSGNTENTNTNTILQY